MQEEMIREQINIVGKLEDSNDIETTKIRHHGDPFAVFFFQESGALEESYIDNDVTEDWKNQSYLNENQEVLEWLYTELKDVFSMDLILKSLQCIIRGGDDAVDSNIVILCEDDNEDSQSKENLASADGNQVSAEE